eukprot:TRINITY_DN6739_c3_g1_i1.p1 TRINITY_DN6739_c3_g1~~TRINITY_DN6739_c3_g1_i1.p1  ORF type:complete len:301 (+),score=47.69 TRINITY_DN6739_c3_g1_i1:45-905(+)
MAVIPEWSYGVMGGVIFLVILWWGIRIFNSREAKERQKKQKEEQEELHRKFEMNPNANRCERELSPYLQGGVTHPGLVEVCGRDGIIVREGESVESTKVGKTIPCMAEVSIVRIKGNRAKIDFPSVGWISLNSRAGGPLVSHPHAPHVFGLPGSEVKITAGKGLKVYVTPDVKAKEVDTLSCGTNIYIHFKISNWGRITSPCEGWIPMKDSSSNPTTTPMKKPSNATPKRLGSMAPRVSYNAARKEASEGLRDFLEETAGAEILVDSDSDSSEENKSPQRPVGHPY